jgi:hypothetical protein
LEIQVRSLNDDVMTLKAAIEEAIIRGQKSVAGLKDACQAGVVSDEDFARHCAESSPGVVGWLDDF